MEFNEFYTAWAGVAERFGLAEFAHEELAAKLKILYEELTEVGSHMNLTAIRDFEGVLTKHFADSLSVAHLIPKNASVIDVGCGAGFPSLPLAIARPDIRVTSLDSTAKKLGFVAATAKKIGLDNIVTLNTRAEDAGRDPAYRESFDVCVARAVSALNVLDELCLPLVKVGGRFIAMKSRLAENELADAERGIVRLGGSDAEHYVADFPDDAGMSRTQLVFLKVGATPREFPRQYSQITKKPLG